MSVLRWLRIFLPLLLVAVIVAAVVLVFSARKDLRQSRANVETQWVQLRHQLDMRYDVLHTAFTDDAVKTVPGPLHVIVENTANAFEHWRDLESHNGSVADEVAAANDLEASGRRLVIAARQAPRLKNNAAALAHIKAYADNALPRTETSTAYEQQVEQFEKLRGRPANRLAASVLGYGAIPDYDAVRSG
jgi:hypothetical protein